MNEKTLRRAIELADGFWWLHRNQVEVPNLNGPALRPLEQQWFLDALAAQLVRQVEAQSEHTTVYNQRWIKGKYVGHACTIGHLPSQASSMHGYSEPIIGPDRTENAINACVEFLSNPGEKTPPRS